MTSTPSAARHTRVRVAAERTPSVLAKSAYVLMFVGLLPALLALWARRLDQLLPLPPYGSPLFGAVVAVIGGILMLSATTSLWVHGDGLPASPFPPRRLVSSGPYRFISHPIYIGAVAVALGASVAAGSAAGLWIVSPVLALAAVAWVLGFERSSTSARFGALPTPLFHLSAEVDDVPSRWERVSVYALVFLPWLILYEGVELLGTPHDAYLTYLAWDYALPVIPWTEIAYLGTYLFVLLAPLVARRSRDLREFAINGLVATAVIIPMYLLTPLVAPAKPVVAGGVWDMLLRWERANDGPITAFPAFHAVWAFLAARVYAAALRRWRAVWYGLAAAMAASCVTTGMHAVADVAAGLVVTQLVTTRTAIWRSVCGSAERIANSWREWTIGPLRIINHGAYAGAGAVAGLVVAAALAGPSSVTWLAGMAIAAVVGAALWAQVVEGSSVLLRPYGYFGAVAGVVVVVLAAAGFGTNGWRLFVAFGIGSTLTYAFGRLRCLVQGCCHGRATGGATGIRYWHPRSRVVRFSNLERVVVYPTPLYSLLWMLGVGAVCIRLWFLAAPLSFIAGVYFTLTGLCRFVEEHYRGEPQTKACGGLRLYQWVALAFVAGGAALTAVQSERAPGAVLGSIAGLPAFCAIGVLVSALYGLDFPRSVRRFSRLG